MTGHSTYDADHMIRTPSIISPYDIGEPALGRRTLADGGALFRQGDPVREMFFIERGILILQRHLSDGRRVPVSRAGKGETIAEASLFADRYHCDCFAEGPAVVAAYCRTAVLDALRTKPDQAMALLQHHAAQIHDLRGRVELLTLHGAERRILAYLALVANADSRKWEMDRTWKAVADETGMSHEALYRALARLERAGRIARRGRTVWLKA